MGWVSDGMERKNTEEKLRLKGTLSIEICTRKKCVYEMEAGRRKKYQHKRNKT
jgi:hypothetical protein